MLREREPSARELAYLKGEVDFFIHDGVDFVFDPERMLFVLKGKETIRSFRPDEHTDVYRFLAEHQDEPGTGLVFSFLGMAETPKMRDNLAQIAADPTKTQATITQTLEVMRTVYNQLAPEIELPDEEIGPTFMRFSVDIGQTGLFKLNTFGNCACFGTDPHSRAVSHHPRNTGDWTREASLPVAYSPHNDDTLAQTVSLLAGAGTLAWISRGGDPDQMTLGLS